MADAPAFAPPLIRRLNRVTQARPRFGLRLAGVVGLALGAKMGDAWTPTASELQELLGELDARTIARLRRRIASGEIRNRALMFLLSRRGSEPMLPLIRVRGADGFQRLRDEKVPLAVGFWHQGVVRSIETALSKLGLPVYAATAETPRGPSPGFRSEPITDWAAGTRFLKEALKELERGGVPLLAIDGFAGPESPRVPLFGRNIAVPPGAGVLAQRAGARIVPATSRWVGSSSRIEVTLHEPLPEPSASRASRREWDREFLGIAASWFERYLRAHPEELRPVNIRMCLSREPAANVETSAAASR